MTKGDHGAFDQKMFATAVILIPNDTGVYTMPVVSHTGGNSRVLEAGRRRSGPAGCGSLAKTELVTGCIPDRKNEVVYIPPLVAIWEVDAGARGVAIRRWPRPSSRPPRVRWRLRR